MIYSKYLSGKYKNEIYFKQNVSDAYVYDDRCVFDLTRGCTFIAPCADKARKHMGESIYDIMTNDEAEELIRYLLNYGEYPMAVSTYFGIALAIPWLAPSSGLGVLVFPYVGTEEICRVAKRKRWKLILSSSVRAMKLRSSKKSYREEDECVRSWELLHESLAPYELLKGVALPFGDITHKLEERVYALSYYTGCPVGIVCNDPVEEFGAFDLQLFTALVLVLMMCARTVSPKREVSVSFESNSIGSVIRLSFIVAKYRKKRVFGIDGFYRIAERKNLFFEHVEGENVIHVRFSPVSPDWALLGLKSPDDGKLRRLRRKKRSEKRCKRR